MQQFKVICFCLVLLILSSTSFAKDDLIYPELQVTPLASERLAIEARNEAKKGLSYYRAIQVSSSLTLLAGIFHFLNPKEEYYGNVLNQKDTDANKSKAYAGIAVGGGWLAATFLLNRYYKPYRAGLKNVKSSVGVKSRGLSRRQTLLRERISEEALKGASSISNRVVWLSILSNMAASILMTGSSDEDTIAPIFSMLSAVTAWTPFVFKNHWGNVYSEHQNYKKRIYAPIAMATLLNVPGSNKVVPGMALKFSF